MRLRAIDYRTILDVLGDIYASTSLDALHVSACNGLERLVPGDCHDLVLCGNDARSEDLFISKLNTYTVEEIRYMLQHAGDHPVARMYQAGATGVISVSQCASDVEWRGSALYAEGGYQRMGLKYEIAVDIPIVCQPSLAALSIARTRSDFTSREREILKYFRPHLAKAWKQARRRSLGHTPAALREVFPILSAREAEILYWIVEGKLNSEISTILERRLLTIQEHVENILRKLGMENRHQLTVRVLRTLHS
ncbi:MAG TPA: helix-turn-helix domain-containing protein [Kiritimatiellia bacterium]|nr:helix-turn-helix domain-containing protein [Kiritimatiellia bacterium]HMO98902.1 helix-turn-helix domain-containing protein [Kiritimatiellia bacterium]HMP96834.1 helix-turn-helix domain-containing protein [Kiritimatiellia bacterium]